MYLLRYDTARDSLKEIIEGRDEDYATDHPIRGD